jgi:outer membrane protein assembly factor BamB
MRVVLVVLVVGCAPAAPPFVLANATHRAAARCPPPDPLTLETEGVPPWERDPLGRWPQCLETDDGARVTIEKDATDADGWRAFLVFDDGAGRQVRRESRAISSFTIAPDGGAVLAHVEDAVSRFGPTGALLWKTAHPYCGHAEIAVGHDGRVVLGCGYSLVAYAADGHLQWQKWPFGNARIAPPLLAADGTMIVRSGSVVAKLDANGEIVWRIDTGGNRYVMPIGAVADGKLVFRTTMAELHTQGDVHIYYPSEPEVVFVISRAGEIRSRQPHEHAAAWPASLPWTPALRAGRLP